MKKIIYTFAIGAAFFHTNTASAQSTSCPNTIAPIIQTGMHGTEIPADQNTPAPTLVTQATGLTNTEFLITKYNTPALDSAGNRDTVGGGGNVIIGADVDGIFMPNTMSRYGRTLAAGDTFEVVAASYNLAQLRSLVQKVLHGSFSGGTCCSVFDVLPTTRGFCDSLTAVGISDSNDIQDLSDVLNVFDAFSARQLSVENLLVNMATINGFSSNVLFPNQCGKSDLPICYGITKTARHQYKVGAPIAVNKLSDVTNFMLFPNPATSDVNIVLETRSNMDLSVRIHNTVGAIVYTQQLGLVNGRVSMQVPVSQLAAGVYFVELTDGKGREIQKLIVR